MRRRSTRSSNFGPRFKVRFGPCGRGTPAQPVDANDRRGVEEPVPPPRQQTIRAREKNEADELPLLLLLLLLLWGGGQRWCGSPRRWEGDMGNGNGVSSSTHEGQEQEQEEQRRRRSSQAGRQAGRGEGGELCAVSLS